MQQRPDKPALLEAVVQFLAGELLPAVSDRALHFRVLIAANLLTTVAAELRDEDARSAREAERLRALLPAVPANPLAAGGEPLRAQLRALDAALCEGLRKGALSPDDPAVREAVRASLREQLAFANPRFDLRDDLDDR